MGKYISQVNGYCDGAQLARGKEVELTDNQAKALGSSVKAIKCVQNKAVSKASNKAVSDSANKDHKEKENDK